LINAAIDLDSYVYPVGQGFSLAKSNPEGLPYKIKQTMEALAKVLIRRGSRKLWFACFLCYRGVMGAS
jgi:hypothetical protein